MSLLRTGGEVDQTSSELTALPKWSSVDQLGPCARRRRIIVASSHPSPSAEAPRLLQIHCRGPVLVEGAMPRRARLEPSCSSHSSVEGGVRLRSSPLRDAPTNSL
eukprot:6460203-Amphidinium_carterae.2